MSRLFDTRDGKFDTRRVETFSDAVLAVAITLMVLRIAPPVARDGQSVGDLFWNETVPDVIYFLITFVVIVLFWIHHHDNFTLLPRRMSAQALWLNMGFLACICLLPFGLEFFSQENATVLTVAVYAGLMAVATIFLGALGRIARGSWEAGAFIGAAVFLLAIPFAPLLGGWCLMVWWIDVPIDRLVRRHRARQAARNP